MPDTPTPPPQPITIKKYANRRLYNTASSSYVTLENLCLMVKENTDFVVIDAKTGEDLTRSVLTQIIVEEENKGQNLLPISFLRQLIAFYGDNMQWLVPSYLESTMKTFAKNQEQMRRYLQEALGGLFPFGGPFEEVGKQNMAMIEQAMKMFTPFAAATGADQPPQPPGASAPQSPDAIREMQQQLDEMKRQLEQIAQPGSPPKRPG
jgi:polyhydroxyalkanoate synthesis repressor PhaR